MTTKDTRFVYRGKPRKKIDFDLKDLDRPKKLYILEAHNSSRYMFRFLPFPHCCAMHILTRHPGDPSGMQFETTDRLAYLAILQHLLKEYVASEEAFGNKAADYDEGSDSLRSAYRRDGERTRTSYLLTTMNRAEMRHDWHESLAEYFGFERLEDDFYNKWHGSQSAIGIFGLNLGRYRKDNM